MPAQKTITLRISDELHKDIKVRIAHEGVSLKDYILSLVHNDLVTRKQPIVTKQ